MQGASETGQASGDGRAASITERVLRQLHWAWTTL